MLTLPSVLHRTVSLYGKRTAVYDRERDYTWAEFAERVRRAAGVLVALGVKPGRRFAVISRNSFRHAEINQAGYWLGAVPVPVNHRLAPPEIRFILDDAECEVVAVDDAFANLVRAEELAPWRERTFWLTPGEVDADGPSYEALLADAEPVPRGDVDENDDAILLYTGGTTGRSKGAMLTQANLSANISQMLSWFPGLRPGEEKIVGVLPLFHVFAMTAVMNFAVASGTEMILLPRYELDQTLKTLSAKKATLFPAVPTIYTAINQAPDLAKYDLSSIRYCMSGGAPLPLEVKRQFEQITGCRLVEGYGLSESSPVATCNAMTGTNKENSIGLPVPGTDITIHDLEAPHDLMPVGERGEVWIKGPQIMKGYLNQAQETTDTLRDGWLRTGDVGYMDDQGHFFLVDRLKDLILCSGYNVYPRMVEEAIYLHSAVSEVTVIGIKDEYRGESPKAFVKLKPNESLNETDLKQFLEDKLSKIEMPSHIEFRDELPKTIIGKLSKKELVAEEQAQQA